MKKILYSLALLLSASTFSQQISESIMVGGVSRDFIYYEPAIYATAGEAVPVLFVFHGLGDNAANMANVGFNAIADTANMIPVYMQGSMNAYNQTSWNNGTLLASTTNDFAFIAQVLDSMQVRYNIDPTKVYATGFSMGGIMSHHLSCANEEFMAIASVSGTMATSDISGCARTTPIRVLHMHGTADGTVPYSGTALPSLSLVPQTLAFYKTYTGCSDSTICRIPDIVADGITVDYIQYNTCNPNNTFEHWRLNGGDHIWPYPPANDIWASKVVWNFLENQDHGYACTPLLGVEELEASFQLEVYPNPSYGQITISSEAEINGIEISNVEGKVFQIKTGMKAHQVYEDVSTLKTGVYFIKVKTDKGDQIKKFIKN